MLRRDGFGLAEAIVALSLLGIMLAALLPAFALNLRANTIAELRTGAVATAQQELDDLRAISVTTWPASGTETDVQTGAATYQVRLTHEPYASGARFVTIQVSHNGRTLYQVETVFTSLDATGL